jgi:hypothetical protein
VGPEDVTWADREPFSPLSLGVEPQQPRDSATGGGRWRDKLYRQAGHLEPGAGVVDARVEARGLHSTEASHEAAEDQMAS